MEIVHLPLDKLREAPWNPNHMDAPMLARLRESVLRFGLVSNLVVRPHTGGFFEVLNGNQRLQVLPELGFAAAPCVVVDLDDARARLLAQALNRIQGEDDLGLRAEVARQLLEELPQEEVTAILPDSFSNLQALAQLGQQDVADYLQTWQGVQAARLKHLTIQLTPAQQEVVEEALNRLAPLAGAVAAGNPNARGNALFLLCQRYLQQEETHDNQ